MMYRDYLVWEDSRTINWDMKREAESDNSDILNGDQPLRTIEQGLQRIFITFEDSEDIFTVKNTQVIYNLTEEIFHHENFKDFCLAISNKNPS